tara:strand:- start:442 stop:1491 length:1050 start_codon:yes stop_codon:yes gene_type:complete
MEEMKQLEQKALKLLHKADLTSGRSDTFLHNIKDMILAWEKQLIKQPKINYEKYSEEISKLEGDIEEAFKSYPSKPLYTLVNDDLDLIRDKLLDIEYTPDLVKIAASRFPLVRSSLPEIFKKYGTKTKSFEALAKLTGKAVLVLDKSYNSYNYDSEKLITSEPETLSTGLNLKILEKYNTVSYVGGKHFSYEFYKGSNPTILIEQHEGYCRYGEMVIPFIKKEDYKAPYNMLVEKEILKYARDTPAIPEVVWDRSAFIKMAKEKGDLVKGFVSLVNLQIKKQIKNNPEVSITSDILKIYSEQIIGVELAKQSREVKGDKEKRSVLIRITAVLNALDQLPDLIVKKSALL